MLLIIMGYLLLLELDRAWKANMGSYNNTAEASEKTLKGDLEAFPIYEALLDSFEHSL